MECSELSQLLFFHTIHQHKNLLRGLTHFIDKIATLKQNTSSLVLNPVNIESAYSSSLAQFNEVAPKPVQKLIQKSPFKSCPLNPIPTQTLKSCSEELVPVITSLINSSLVSAIFPDVLKDCRLLPIIKKIKLNKEDFNSFRQITNLERSVTCQCDHYLVKNQLYLKSQAAYQQFHSTETALRVHNDMLRALDRKKGSHSSSTRPIGCFRYH